MNDTTNTTPEMANLEAALRAEIRAVEAEGHKIEGHETEQTIVPVDPQVS